MLKTKKSRIVLVAIMVFSMVAMYAYVPKVSAAITDAKDTISNSDISAQDATHVFTFTTGASLAENEYLQVTFPGGFTGLVEGNITCPANSTASLVGQDARCIVNAGQTLAVGAKTITVTTVDSPGTAGPQTLTISGREADADIKESVDVMVYIIQDVTVTARVPANLTFAIDGVAAAQDVNGENTTVTTIATSVPFGTLDTGVAGIEIAAQRLSVSTNAEDGFSVTVQQSDELSNPAGSNINSFNNSPDNTGSTTPGAWASPSAKIDETNTYGHMGFTTSDSTLTGGLDPFGTALYAGLNNTAAREIMYHDGPANGTIDGVGLASVGFKIEISAMQEAGDYSTTLTYICTPQY